MRGNYGFYFILDQMLYREPPKVAEITATAERQEMAKAPLARRTVECRHREKKSEQGLGWFGRIAFEPQDRNFIGFYFDTGLNYKGLIPDP